MSLGPREMRWICFLHPYMSLVLYLRTIFAVEIHFVLVGTKCNWTSVLVLHLKSKLSFSYAETI